VKLIRNLDKFPASLRGGAITIGNFDGVHRGHATIIDRLKHQASLVGGAAIVFTFDPHPVRVLRPEQAPAPLTWTDRKADLLAELGVDVVVAYPTDRKLLSLTHNEFFAEIVQEKLGARAMIEGPNFYFGKNRGGDVNVLRSLCDDADINLEIVTPIQDSAELISSSRIRTLVAAGDVGPAAAMLTNPYRIRGMVTHGAARGSQIGFPTANLDAIDTLIPAAGVYAGRTYVDGRSHWSAIHVGPNPTFGENMLKVESHILDFDRSLYGSVVEVDFISRLRDILRFESKEQLIQQLAIDIGAARKIASAWPALP
jgi:riboflavin kinase/FMN adenylyltransferase